MHFKGIIQTFILLENVHFYMLSYTIATKLNKCNIEEKIVQSKIELKISLNKHNYKEINEISPNSVYKAKWRILYEYLYKYVLKT